METETRTPTPFCYTILKFDLAHNIPHTARVIQRYIGIKFQVLKIPVASKHLF